MYGENRDVYPKALRTHTLRLLGPKIILYKALQTGRWQLLASCGAQASGRTLERLNITTRYDVGLIQALQHKFSDV